MPISGEPEIGGLALVVVIWRKRCPLMQTPGAVGGRAQFQLWIFSYTIRARSSKKWVSRIKIGPGDGFGIVARMEPSGLAFGKPKDRLREIRGGASNERYAMVGRKADPGFRHSPR